MFDDFPITFPMDWNCFHQQLKSQKVKSFLILHSLTFSSLYWKRSQEKSLEENKRTGQCQKHDMEKSVGDQTWTYIQR